MTSYTLLVHMVLLKANRPPNSGRVVFSSFLCIFICLTHNCNDIFHEIELWNWTVKGHVQKCQKSRTENVTYWTGSKVTYITKYHRFIDQVITNHACFMQKLFHGISILQKESILSQGNENCSCQKTFTSLNLAMLWPMLSNLPISSWLIFCSPKLTKYTIWHLKLIV